MYYRNFNNFNEELFLTDFDNLNLSVNFDSPHENYTNLSQTLSEVFQKYALLRKEILIGNHVPFFGREFRKKIYK